LLCGVAACELGGGPIGSTTTGHDPDQLNPGVVTRVNDGDSVVVEMGNIEVEVRLLGINAPEAGECFYEHATDRLTAIVDGKTVEVAEGGTDQFGRTLGSLWLEGSLVNLGLVTDGFAIATTPVEGEINGEALITAEEEAATNRVGLWAMDACGSSGPLPNMRVDSAGSQFDPPGADGDQLDQEWVEFNSDQDVDLDGWTVRDESSTHRCLLPAGVVVVPGIPLRVNSADDCWHPGHSPVWNNGGDMVLLLDPTGRIVSRARYDD